MEESERYDEKFASTKRIEEIAENHTKEVQKRVDSVPDELLFEFSAQNKHFRRDLLSKYLKNFQ